MKRHGLLLILIRLLVQLLIKIYLHVQSLDLRLQSLDLKIFLLDDTLFVPDLLLQVLVLLHHDEDGVLQFRLSVDWWLSFLECDETFLQSIDSLVHSIILILLLNIILANNLVLLFNLLHLEVLILLLLFKSIESILRLLVLVSKDRELELDVFKFSWGGS